MDYTPADIARAWADKPHLLWLDSADSAHPNARWSYVMAEPRLWITGDGEESFAAIREALADHKPENREGPAPFQGGIAGLFSYDGTIAAGLYTSLFAYEHDTKKGYFIGCDAPLNIPPAADEPEPPALEWDAEISARDYQSRVQKVIDYIKAGDIFQANLSQRFEADLPPDFKPLAHYLKLRKANPVPFGGYFDAGPLQISCCSPERFLQLSDTGRIETKPIKGTAPRHADPAKDKASADALQASMKDRAENIMIVDLLRNDLSQVCTPKSVVVESLCALESFAKVHHLVSTITAHLQEGEDALSLLKACFPGGSITGAPKIRAMEIIDELEDSPRGPYTGSLGWIGFDGAMDTNILIRSIVYTGAQAILNVGGGVTARSEPEAEYLETLDKAAGMKR